jgi:hypothetical protein
MSTGPIEAVVEETPIYANVIIGGLKGDKGDTGSTGQTGATGPAGTGAATYIWTQNTPSTVWTITHNMGNYPAVYTEDSAQGEIIGDVSYPDTNTVVVSFSTPEAGLAYLN